jgi:hypothetical protein
MATVVQGAGSWLSRVLECGASPVKMGRGMANQGSVDAPCLAESHSILRGCRGEVDGRCAHSRPVHTVL